MRLFQVSAFLLAMFGSMVAFGEGSDKVVFTIEAPVLSYSQSQTKDKPESGTETTEKSTDITTNAQSELYLSALVDGKYAFYYYPNVHAVSVGYYILESLELGLDFGMNSEKSKNDDTDADSEDTSNTYGLYAFYYLPVGTNVTEIYGVYDLTSSVNKTKDSKTDSNIKTAESLLKIGAQYVCNITDGFQYVGGVSYSMSSSKNSGDNKDESSESGLSLRLAAVRFSF